MIDAYSNVASDDRSGRRAINSTADLSTIVNSTVTNLSADQISTLGSLSVEHMGIFASDGIGSIDNFTTPLPSMKRISLSIYAQQLRLKGKFNALIGDAPTDDNLQMWAFGEDETK